MKTTVRVRALRVVGNRGMRWKYEVSGGTRWVEENVRAGNTFNAVARASNGAEGFLIKPSWQPKRGVRECSDNRSGILTAPRDRLAKGEERAKVEVY